MLHVRMLGAFDLRLDGKAVDFSSKPLRLLLAYLVLNAGRTLLRAKVAGVLWPDSPERTARKNLRHVIWRLRQAIGETYVTADRHTVSFNTAAPYKSDVETLQQEAGVGTSALIQAAASYRGELLPGDYEEWVHLERERLRAVFEEQMRVLLERLEVGERWSDLVTWSEHWIAFGRTPEPAFRALMIAHARRGDRSGLVASYRRYEHALAIDLGVEPAPETRALYEALRADLVPYRGTPAELGAGKKRRLPSPVMRFVGRRRELADVGRRLVNGCRLLTLLGPGGSGKSRLALEVARRHAAGYRHGAAFVDLATLSDPANIPTNIATALDFRFTSEGSPQQQILNYLANKELLLVLDNVEHLLDKHLLDPHLPDAAELVNDLLQAAPHLHIMATSRARLKLGSECLFEVGGLSLPEDGRVPENGLQQEGDFETSEALALFMERARRVEPGFALEGGDTAAVARICRLVEGMPLAIELAASWVRILAPEGIARELADDVDFLESERADLPERQRSMRAAFDHSWNLLDEHGREALMKLAVFRGGADRQAASAVTGASLGTLVFLADHSLLRPDPASGRFATHEVIRQFAAEKLEKSRHVVTVRDAHSAYYLQALAERLPDLKGRDQLGALKAIDDDFENVRAAWRWATRQAQWQHVPHASQSLFLFALFRSRHRDGIELFEGTSRAITSPTTSAEQLAHTYAITSGQALRSSLGLYETTLTAVPALQAAAEALTDPAAVAFSQMMIGRILTYDAPWGDAPSQATAALNAARAYYRQAQEPFYHAMALWRLGVARIRALQREEALDLHRRALALAREAGDRFVAAALLHDLGSLTWALEGPSEATEGYYQEAANLYWEIGARAPYAISLAHLAGVPVWREGDLAKSHPMLEEALAIAAEQNIPLLRASALTTLATHRLLKGEYAAVLGLTEKILGLEEKNTWCWCWATFQHGVAFLALGRLDESLPFMKRGLSSLYITDHKSWIGAFLAYYGVLLARQGEHRWAAELLALGLTGPHGAGLEIDPLLTRTRAELAETLGEEAFAAAWQRGRQLEPLAAASEVLEMPEAWETAA